MANPMAMNRPHANSSPKHGSIATPTAMMPSPRPPTSAAMVRNISHKSLAGKTPGHAHNFSTSSHPSSTPLTALALGDETLNFSSPAAIFMSNHGLTPMPTGADGLGISAHLSMAGTTDSVLAPRNVEEEKLRRLQDVVEALKVSLPGRGTCREGVERLAQLASFTHLWQDDTLAIAGDYVDLEVSFDPIEKNKVRGVVLKISMPDAEMHRQDASTTLKSNLELDGTVPSQVPWRHLRDFAANLEQLGNMDRLSKGVNCFEAIDGLYHAFRKIWEGEKGTREERKTSKILNSATLGRPFLNKVPRLGLSVEYWAEGGAVTDASADDPSESSTGLWKASIDCEPGYPALRVSKEWVMEGIFYDQGHEAENSMEVDLPPKVSWAEPPPTLPITNAGDALASVMDLATGEGSQPEPVRFAATLFPTVLVPWAIASSFAVREGLYIALDNSKVKTYDEELRGSLKGGPSVPANPESGSTPRPGRWTREVSKPNSDNQVESSSHSYNLYASEQLWWYPIQSIAFDHPRHLSEIFPILRQYILLWTLIRNIGPSSLRKDVNTTASPSALTLTPKEADSNSNRKPSRFKNKSNLDPRKAKLENIFSKKTQPAQEDQTLFIDISLSLTSCTPSRPKIELIWPIHQQISGGTKGVDEPFPSNFASLAIEIGVGGEVFVTSCSGLPFVDSRKGMDGIAEMIRVSEDLGLVVELLLDRLRRMK